MLKLSSQLVCVVRRIRADPVSILFLSVLNDLWRELCVLFAGVSGLRSRGWAELELVGVNILLRKSSVTCQHGDLSPDNIRGSLHHQTERLWDTTKWLHAKTQNLESVSVQSVGISPHTQKNNHLESLFQSDRGTVKCYCSLRNTDRLCSYNQYLIL